MADTGSTVEWNGDAILEATAKAAILGMDETLALCTAGAIGKVHIVSSDLQGSIHFEPSKRVSKFLVAGQWGSYDINYALIEEIRHPYLRPQADTYYGGTGKRIGKHLEGKV